MTGPNSNSPRLLAIATALTISAIVSACSPTPQIVSVDQNHARGSAAILAAEAKLIAFRHDLHRHPELSQQEKRTSRKIAEQLYDLGFEVRTQVGGYGVVGVLKGEGPGASSAPMIAFRADMDASRDFSKDPAPYAANVEGVRHNCGHDVHSTIGIGLAVAFAEIKDTLPGNVMLIFQPAEETGTGARAMLTDGIFDETKPDAILALHTYPIEVGELATRPGALMAGRARLAITLTGTGDLSGAAARVRDVLAQTSTVAPDTSLQLAQPDFLYIELEPQRTPTPDDQDGKVVVRGLVMSAGVERRAMVEQRIRRVIGEQDFPEVDIEVYYQQALEGVNNDEAVLDVTKSAITSTLPDTSIEILSEMYPAFSEDFGSFQQEVPGVMLFIGVNNSEAGTVGFPHSPNYVADDSAIVFGARAMLAAALALMENAQSQDRSKTD